MTPYSVQNKFTHKYQDVPCGKCPACFKRRVSGWSFRLLQEEKKSTSAHFITLTYDTKNVHITPNGYMDLNKRDVQLFFKRLRKCHTDEEHPIKYFCVGEYGGKSARPHFHLIIFNVHIPTIQPAWQLGSIHYGQVTGASIGYTLKYMSKIARIPMHKNDDRTPEFGQMSKGLGISYLTENMLNWHLNPVKKNERMYLNLKDGKKVSMPRYYKNKIYTDEERKVIGVKARIQMLKADLKAESENPNYHNEKFMSAKAAFRKMERDSKKGNII